MNDEIFFVLERFPSHKQAILNAYTNNEEFKTLCEDLYATARTLENIHQKRLKDLQNELEYKNLFVDLEKELLTFLAKRSGTSKSSGQSTTN